MRSKTHKFLAPFLAVSMIQCIPRKAELSESRSIEATEEQSTENADDDERGPHILIIKDSEEMGLQLSGSLSDEAEESGEMSQRQGQNQSSAPNPATIAIASVLGGGALLGILTIGIIASRRGPRDFNAPDHQNQRTPAAPSHGNLDLGEDDMIPDLEPLLDRRRAQAIVNPPPAPAPSIANRAANPPAGNSPPLAPITPVSRETQRADLIRALEEIANANVEGWAVRTKNKFWNVAGAIPAAAVWVAGFWKKALTPEQKLMKRSLEKMIESRRPLVGMFSDDATWNRKIDEDFTNLTRKIDTLKEQPAKVQEAQKLIKEFDDKFLPKLFAKTNHQTVTIRQLGPDFRTRETTYTVRDATLDDSQVTGLNPDLIISSAATKAFGENKYFVIAKTPGDDGRVVVYRTRIEIAAEVAKNLKLDQLAEKVKSPAARMALGKKKDHIVRFINAMKYAVDTKAKYRILLKELKESYDDLVKGL